MPIRPENRHYYRGEAYEQLRATLRERAGDKCEHCGAPNGERIFFTRTGDDPHDFRAVWWDGHFWITSKGVSLPFEVLKARGSRLYGGPNLNFGRYVDVVCGAAHLDHDPRHQDPERCAWLCARCHLLHDQKNNHARARRNEAKETGQQWLSQDLEFAPTPEVTR